jgi:hypothetical protein
MRSHEEVPVAINCGMNFHPRQQSISYYDTADYDSYFSLPISARSVSFLLLLMVS